MISQAEPVTAPPTPLATKQLSNLEPGRSTETAGTFTVNVSKATAESISAYDPDAIAEPSSDSNDPEASKQLEATAGSNEPEDTDGSKASADSESHIAPKATAGSEPSAESESRVDPAASTETSTANAYKPNAEPQQPIISNGVSKTPIITSKVVTTGLFQKSSLPSNLFLLKYKPTTGNVNKLPADYSDRLSGSSSKTFGRKRLKQYVPTPTGPSKIKLLPESSIISTETSRKKSKQPMTFEQQLDEEWQQAEKSKKAEREAEKLQAQKNAENRLKQHQQKMQYEKQVRASKDALRESSIPFCTRNSNRAEKQIRDLYLQKYGLPGLFDTSAKPTAEDECVLDLIVDILNNPELEANSANKRPFSTAFNIVN